MNVLTLTNPKHFKWLRFLMVSLKNSVHYVENDYKDRRSPKADGTDGAEYVTPREVNTLTITETGAVFHSVDERLGWVFVKTETYEVGKRNPVKSEKHQYFRSQEWIDKAKADLEEYLKKHTEQRVAFNTEEEYELLPLDFYKK